MRSLWARLRPRWGWTLGAGLLALAMLYGLLRGPLAGFMFAELQQRAHARGLTLSAAAVEPYGFIGLRLDSLRVVRADAPTDTVATAGRLELALRLRYLLIGEPAPAELRLTNALLTLPDSLPERPVRADSSATRPAAAAPLSLAKRLSRPWGRVAPLRSATVSLQNVHLLWGRGPEALHVGVDSLAWGEGPAAGRFHLNGRPWLLTTRADTLWAETDRAQLIAIPPLVQRLGLKLGARRLALARLDIEGSSEVDLILRLRADELLVQHRRLSRETFAIPQLELTLDAHAGERWARLDSTSRVVTNGLVWRPYLHLALPQADSPDTTLTAALWGPDTTAQTYLDALTAGGLFTSLKGMKADGRWRYLARLSFDSHRPDTLAFTSAMNARGFRIRRWGPARLSSMADTFTHRPMGTARRRFIGPSNPDFTPLPEIVSYVPDAVLTAEDPSFRWHRGFSEAAIGESILQNYRQGRFARGGSTLSMQLIKNVYLSSEKTLARKLEEALLVWMLEDGRLVPKDRLLEVYLNIIEWGPDVYGIRQAARYYFDKQPDQLDLHEAIFLALIIPRPRKFMYHFDALGEPKPHVGQFRDLIAGLMAGRKLVSADEAALAGVMPLTLGRAARDAIREHFAKTPTGSLLQQIDLEYDLLDDEADFPTDSTGGQGPR